MSVKANQEGKMEHPEPIWNAENMNRKKGSTTFKQCGWCKHTASGSVRFNCYLSTSCALLKSYGELNEDLYWDTSCVVMRLGKEDLLDIIRSKQYEIKESKNQIKSLNEEISTLKRIKIKKRPPLPDNRVEDFNEGEIVWVMYHETKKWVRGTVVPGYRSHDGCVSYVLEGYPESQKGWGCGVSVPCVLKDWEYKYFKTNLDDFSVWLKLCDRKYNGEKLDLKAYFEAMKGDKNGSKNKTEVVKV